MSSYYDITSVGDIKTMKNNRLFRILYYVLEKEKLRRKSLPINLKYLLEQFIETSTL